MRLAALLLALLPLPLHAVTSLTVNGLTEGQLQTPCTMRIECDCPVGGQVAISLAVDQDGDGGIGPGELILAHMLLGDGTLVDSDPREGYLRFDYVFPDHLSAPFAVRVADPAGASLVEHGFLATYAMPQSVSGTVYHEDGTPFPGVVITTDYMAGDEVCRTVSRPDGTYELPVGEGLVVLRPYTDPIVSAPARYRLHVWPGGHPGSVNFSLPDAPDSQYLTGRFLDDAGRPVPGAWFDYDVRPMPMPMLPADIDGHYRRLPARSGERWVRVPNGWQPQRVVVPEGEGRFDVTVPRATAALSGRVLCDSEAVPGAAVRARPVGARSPAPLCGVADAAGVYTIWLTPRQHYVEAIAVGYGMRIAEPCFGTPGTPADIPLVAASTAVCGTVTDPFTGAPAMASVFMLQVDYTSGYWKSTPLATHTDAQGRYRLPVPRGRWAPRADYADSPCRDLFVPPEGRVDFTSLYGPAAVSGSVSPARGNSHTVFTFTATTINGGAAVVFIDGVPHAMAPADPAADPFAPTQAFRYSTTVPMAASPSHRYYFCCSGVVTAFSAETRGPLPGAGLDSGSLTPGSGSTQTDFAAAVRYQDLRGNGPQRVELNYQVGDGPWVALPMTTTGTDFLGGVEYTWHGRLPAGRLRYYFSSYGRLWPYDPEVCRWPADGCLEAKVADIGISQGAVTPTSGGPRTSFTFTVTAASSLDEPMSVLLQLYSPGCVVPMEYPMATTDNDGTANGAIYTVCLGDLPQGEYRYNFVVRLEGDAVLYQPQPLSGPRVTSGAPLIRISPADGRCRGVVTIEATVTATDPPDSIGKVWFFLDGVYQESCTEPPYRWVWDTVTASDGRHRIAVQAMDSSEHFAQARAVLIVDNTTFDDVPRTSPQWAYIEAVAREGITGGCSQTPPLFCPSAALTRGQLAVFLCRAAGLQPYDRLMPSFLDVPPTSPIYGYVEALRRARIVSGCATGRYCPNAIVTRGQMAVFLCRAAGWPTLATVTQTFADVPSWDGQSGYIEQLYRRGVTTGCAADPLRYCPGRPVTRGQMAVFLCRTFAIRPGL